MIVPSGLVYLASGSPRRRDLLEQMQIVHVVLEADSDEDMEALEVRLDDESPRSYVRRVARLKSENALRRIARRGLPPAPVLTGDTTVAIGHDILGKPASEDEARDMLQRLSGRAHRVLSAVVVTDSDRSEEALSESRVRFRPLSAADIDAYIASREPFRQGGCVCHAGTCRSVRRTHRRQLTAASSACRCSRRCGSFHVSA